MKKNTLLTSLVPLWVYPLTTLALTGFVRLITNPNGKARYGSISDESHPLVKIRKYLHFILTGNDGDAFCPFVRLIERKNAYFVRLHSGALTRTMLNESVLDLENAFHALSNCVGKGESVTDPTTVVVGFLDKNVSSEEGLALMEEIHAAHRPVLLAKGFMIAYMHPLHPTGRISDGGTGEFGTEPIFVCDVPLFVLRKIHEKDLKFMRTENEKELYQRIFPSKLQKCPYHNK